jgi:hypothetical protein
LSLRALHSSIHKSSVFDRQVIDGTIGRISELA